MITFTSKTRIYSKFLIALAVLLLSFSLAYAQTETATTNNNILLTWEAQNYYPSNYEGKAVASQGTPVLVSATGITDNSFVDLSDAEFLWYLDGTLFKRGVGISEIIFDATKSSGQSHFVRVVATLNGSTFRQTTLVPVKKAKAVIEYPATSKKLQTNQNITLASTPYFFTVSTFSELQFYWEINGSLQDEKTRTLTINSNNEDIGPGYNLITAIIANKSNQLEAIRSNIQINAE